MEEDTPQLTPEAGDELVRIARGAIEEALRGEGERAARPPVNAVLALPGAAFVTLRTAEGLRGCIGTLESRTPLHETVRRMALSSAFEDPRFPPVRPEELPAIAIEISVPSPLRRITTPEEVTVGTHGLYIRQGVSAGVLLPQVPFEQGWDREVYLQQACRKAGLPPTAWRDAETEIFVFTAAIIREAWNSHGRYEGVPAPH